MNPGVQVPLVSNVQRNHCHDERDDDDSADDQQSNRPNGYTINGVVCQRRDIVVIRALRCR